MSNYPDGSLSGAPWATALTWCDVCGEEMEYQIDSPPDECPACGYDITDRGPDPDRLRDEANDREQRR